MSQDVSVSALEEVTDGMFSNLLTKSETVWIGILQRGWRRTNSGFRFQVYNSLPYVYMLIGCVRCRERNKWIERTVLMRKGKR